MWWVIPWVVGGHGDLVLCVLANLAEEQGPGVDGWTGNEEENSSSTSLSLLIRIARSSGQTFSWFLWL